MMPASSEEMKHLATHHKVWPTKLYLTRSVNYQIMGANPIYSVKLRGCQPLLSHTQPVHSVKHSENISDPDITQLAGIQYFLADLGKMH